MISRSPAILGPNIKVLAWGLVWTRATQVWKPISHYRHYYAEQSTISTIHIITLNNPQGASGSTFYGCIFLFSMLPCTLTCSVLHGNCIYTLVQCTKSLHSVVLDNIYDHTVQCKIYSTMYIVTNYNAVACSVVTERHNAQCTMHNVRYKLHFNAVA